MLRGERDCTIWTPRQVRVTKLMSQKLLKKKKGKSGYYISDMATWTSYLLKPYFLIYFLMLISQNFNVKFVNFPKIIRYPFLWATTSLKFLVSMIHSDVWGCSSTVSNSKYKWFVTFIDDCTRTTWIYLFKEKSKEAVSFQNFHKTIQTQFESKILNPYLVENGIVHSSSCTDTPSTKW